MTVGFCICLFSLIYTWTTKKYQLVYWTFSILGVNIVGFALNFLPETTHFGDFIWMFSALALAFYGLPRKIAILLMGLAFIYIAYFSFKNVNINIDLLKREMTSRNFHFLPS